MYVQRQPAERFLPGKLNRLPGSEVFFTTEIINKKRKNNHLKYVSGFVIRGQNV